MSNDKELTNMGRRELVDEITRLRDELERVRNYFEPYKEFPDSISKARRVWRALRKLLSLD